MLQDSASPLVTAQACTSGLSSESAQPHDSGHTDGSVLESDSAQCPESAQSLEANLAHEMHQQPHKPGFVASSGSLKHQRMVTADSLSVAPSTHAVTDTDGATAGVTDAVTDAHTNTAAASPYDVQHHHHDHLHTGLGFLPKLEGLFSESTAPETPQLSAPDSTEVAQVAAHDSAEVAEVAAHDSAEVTQVAAPESANLPQAVAPSSADVNDSSELAGMKPEQKALLAKGLQLCMQVDQVHPFSRSHPIHCLSQPLQSSCS